MNSILQCLSHTHKLTELILSGEAVKNKKPPSGGLVESKLQCILFKSCLGQTNVLKIIIHVHVLALYVLLTVCAF